MTSKPISPVHPPLVFLHLFLLIKTPVLLHRHRRLNPTPSPQHPWINRAVPSNLFLLVLDVFSWPLRADGIFVLVNEDTGIVAEEAVDVFEGAVCGLWVEEIYDR